MIGHFLILHAHMHMMDAAVFGIIKRFVSHSMDTTIQHFTLYQWTKIRKPRKNDNRIKHEHERIKKKKHKRLSANF